MCGEYAGSPAERYLAIPNAQGEDRRLRKNLRAIVHGAIDCDQKALS